MDLVADNLFQCSLAAQQFLLVLVGEPVSVLKHCAQIGIELVAEI